MKNIMVALDFEENSRTLLNKAKEIGEKFNAKIWILHVAAPQPEFIGYETGPQYVRDFRAIDLKREHKLLQQYSNLMKADGLDSEGLLISGESVSTIVEKAKSLNIDMVIIGHHHHGLIYKAFVGGTDTKILNRIEVPVLIVPLPY